MISSLVNFGALTAFAILNVAVIWYYIGKQHSKRWFVHLICPLLGLVVLVFVLINARSSAQIVGLVWLAIGVVLGMCCAAGGSTPRLLRRSRRRWP